MTTGKIEFAPDYKSAKPNTRFIFVDEPGAIGREAELARLEREVLKAVRAWFRGAISEGGLRIAVMALESFEANQK